MAARVEPGERNRDPNPFEISRWKATRSSRKAEDGCDLSHRNVAMKYLASNSTANAIGWRVGSFISILVSQKNGASQ
jgi:hypothetical protein